MSIFSAIAKGFPADPISVARLCKVVILVKIRLLDEYNPTESENKQLHCTLRDQTFREITMLLQQTQF